MECLSVDELRDVGTDFDCPPFQFAKSNLAGVKSSFMKYRVLRKANLKVSEVGFGMWTVSTGWWGKFTEAEAIALMHKALDLGMNLFDAADTYGNGLSEELLAKAFPKQRDEIVIATKVGYDFYNYGEV